MNVWFYFKREDLTVVSGEDNLCMFRCLAVFNESRDMEAEVEKSRARWVKANGPIVRGISVAHLDRFEAMFGVGVAIYINKIDGCISERMLWDVFYTSAMASIKWFNMIRSEKAGLERYFISMYIIAYLMIVFPLILTYIGILSTTNGLIWYLRQTRGAVIGYSCQSVSLPYSRLRFTLSPFQPSMG